MPAKLSSSLLNQDEAVLAPKDRLAIRGRPIDPFFADAEELFLRFEEATSDGTRIAPASMSVSYPGSDGMSVNREKYSQPTDVLWPHWLDLGLASVAVGKVTKLVFEAGDKGRTYAMATEHEPAPAIRSKRLPENYAHSLVKTVCPPEPFHRTPSKKVKKEARLELAKVFQVLVVPSSRKAEPSI